MGLRMVEGLPAVQRALVAGQSNVPKALVLCDGVAGLDREVAQRIVGRPVEKAAELTTDPPLYDDHRYIHPPFPGDP